MDVELKTSLINEIGLFDYGKANWLEYTIKMDSYFQANFISSEQKKEICIAAVGGKTLKTLKVMIRPKKLQDPEVTYEFIIEALERHFYPNPDSSFYINKFTLRKQMPRESFFEYVVALRKLIINCRFPKKGQHSKLRNQLITGAREALKEKFNANSMSLSQVFETGLLWDDSRIPAAAPPRRNHKARINRVAKCFRCAVPVSKHNNQPCSFDWALCSGCGVKGHLSLACKYKDLSCNNCQGKGHIAKMCKAPAVIQNGEKPVEV
ncbi:unnamed protein product [Psylliodes chrysocephalus]|uniref:CCHC-type domain-containing protein n=1 Tax=Psylliodes chrysocephalus TaxID=3402493 RepID=A0A9P0CIZ1_9CUCU|nr:unnamed protein product [Psylliodes chrysocephala]